jgi:hypothetical protein
MASDKVVIDRWLFNRMVADVASAASALGSISRAGGSVATFAALQSLGLVPGGQWRSECTSAVCDGIGSGAGELGSDELDALGEEIEGAAWAARRDRLQRDLVRWHAEVDVASAKKRFRSRAAAFKSS